MTVCDGCEMEIEDFLAERCDACFGTFCPSCIDDHVYTVRDEDG